MMIQSPHKMIDSMLKIINDYLNRHFGEGSLSAKDVFIMSRYMHIYLSAL